MRVRWGRLGSAFLRRATARGFASALLVTSLALSSSVACKKEVLTTRPPRARGIPVRADHPNPSSPESYQAPPGGPAAPAAEQEPTAMPSSGPERADEKPERDFSAELVRMMGDPSSCLKPRAAENAPSNLAIAVTASVMPSGAVGQTEVSAAELDSSELACLKARAAGLHFAPPIENAPFSVRGTVQLTRDVTHAPLAAKPVEAPPANADPSAAPPPVTPSTEPIPDRPPVTPSTEPVPAQPPVVPPNPSDTFGQP
jgi:hypothetical protein